MIKLQITIHKSIYIVKKWKNKPCKTAMQGYKIGSKHYIIINRKGETPKYLISEL